MHPQYPWTTPVSSRAEKVGLFSIGSLEDKIPYVLYPLLLSSNIALSVYKNYKYPKDLSLELISEIKSSLRKENMKYVIFDLRIQNWTNTRYYNHSRLLSQSLQDNCDELEINSSIILSNGDQLIGNTVGVFTEMMEAGEVLGGKGPADLTKFALEIGADFLLMTRKAQQSLDAKKWLRDKIISGELSETGKKTITQAASFLDLTERFRLFSPRNGYVHHLAMDGLHALKSELTNTHPGICIFLKKKPGDRIEKGENMIELYLPMGQKNSLKQETCQKVFDISSDPPNHQPLMLERLGLNLHS